jgi:hypothetical protein
MYLRLGMLQEKWNLSTCTFSFQRVRCLNVFVLVLALSYRIHTKRFWHPPVSCFDNPPRFSCLILVKQPKCTLWQAYQVFSPLIPTSYHPSIIKCHSCKCARISLMFLFIEPIGNSRCTSSSEYEWTSSISFEKFSWLAFNSSSFVFGLGISTLFACPPFNCKL